MGDPIGKVSQLIDTDDNLTLAAFVYAATAKETNGSSFANAPLDMKAKIIANSVTGRTVGLTVFKDAPSYPATFNISNALNKTTFIGLGLWAASEAGFLGSKWGPRGKKIATGGAVGGVFDDPIASSSTALTGFSGSAYPVANYTNSARNGLPVGGGAPWTQ